MTAPRRLPTRLPAGRGRSLPALLFALLCAATGDISAADAPASLPSFAELEAAGAVIGEIRIDPQNIFDLQDEREDNGLFRFANAVHISTQPQVIRRQLLFGGGDRVSVQRIEETERILRGHVYLYDVSIRPVAYRDGVVDIEVRTRDTWSLVPGVRFSRTGGANHSGFSLRDSNALGSGSFFGISRTSDPTRSGNELRFNRPNAIDGWTNVEIGSAQLSDGQRRNFALDHPFYALDARWSAGVHGSTDNRLETVYSNNSTQSQYRHRRESGDLSGGWSDGLVDGRTRRYSYGISFQKDDYAAEAGAAAPAQLPVNVQLAAPFVAYEVIEDAFEKVKNRDRIERTEYFALGFQSRAQLARSFAALGSTQELWLYSASASDGYRLAGGQTLLAEAAVSGQTGFGALDRRQMSSSARYYGREVRSTRFFASISVEGIRTADGTGQLLNGGDNGMRGYPRTYQSGDRRAVFTAEQRAYSDWYPFRLFRVGGAVFFDSGRAWGGPTQNTLNAGWLNDFGIGLRILSARSAFGNVTHIDLAFPTHRDSSISRVQLLVQTKLSF